MHQPRRAETKPTGILKGTKESPHGKPQDGASSKEGFSRRPQSAKKSAAPPGRASPRHRTENPKKKPGSAVRMRPGDQEEDLTNFEVKEISETIVEQIDWTCPVCTFKNNPTRPGCEQCSTAKPSGDVASMQLKGQIPAADLEKQPDTADGALDGWACPLCSYVNRPRRPGCEICGGEPPADYDLSQAPEDPEEEARLQNQRENERRFLEEMMKKNQEEFEELCQKDNQNLVEPDQPFECPVCMTDIEVEDGVRLRGCLHDVCKQCFIQSVANEETGVVRCAHCGFEVEDRDIKNVVDPALWERRLKMTLKMGEAKVKNTFHCLTLDCEGWVEVVDKFNCFRCQVCLKVNCLVCRAQHPGQSCKQHQDELRRQCTSEEDAKATMQFIEEQIQIGQMMRCVGCQLVLQKKAGCDWMQCPQCNMELCWVTKGPRWGPKGNGDISGGCRCGIDGRKCHPSCGFCH